MLEIAEGGDSTQAVPILEKMCAKGRDVACGNLAQILAIGQTSRRDPVRARELGLASCKHGIAAGCNAAGLVAANDEPRDPAFAALMFTDACNGGSFGACHNLAIAYLSGLGVRRDDAEGERLLRKACDGGQASACTELGRRRASQSTH